MGGGRHVLTAETEKKAVFSASRMEAAAKFVDPASEPVPVPATAPFLRFVVLGDFGTCERFDSQFRCVEGNSDAQQTVARAMQQFHAGGDAQKFAFGSPPATTSTRPASSVPTIHA
jgi:hypothetical protein